MPSRSREATPTSKRRSTGARQYRQELTADPEQLGRIRRIVTAYARCWGRDEVIHTASVCVTEMLSNVTKHTDSLECTLTLESSPTGIRIVVSDHSRRLPVVREPDWAAEEGRGMYLLSCTADAWGADLTTEGKDVWVEVRAPTETA